MDIAGHVSRNMLKHYSRLRMEAKQDALESLVDEQFVDLAATRQHHQCLRIVWVEGGEIGGRLDADFGELRR
jgi:hypothetical protein